MIDAHNDLINLTHLVRYKFCRRRILPEHLIFGTELLDEAGNHFLCVVNGAGDVLDLLEGRAAKRDPDARAAARHDVQSSVITLFMSSAFVIFNSSFAIRRFALSFIR